MKAGQRIRRLRRRKGLTQENLADLIHTSQERISKIETGRLQIKADEYFEIMELLANVEKVASFTINDNQKGALVK
jgi:transcriptional regulator with XRE-family HTH domain